MRKAAHGARREETASRVTSADGTEIAYFTSGEGPALVLVHGSLGDHTRWTALRPHLEPHFTLHAMDRRGRGASGDAPEYDFERELEDVAAVVDAVAEVAGTAVDVLGSSGGAAYSIGAAARTANVRRLVLFEPPGAQVLELLPAEFLDRLDAMLAAGDREGVLVAAYRAVVGLSDEEIEHLRRQPEWPNRIAAAHTVPRELRLRPERLHEAQQPGSVDVPALVLVGGETSQPFKDSAEAVTSRLRRAELEVVDGQGHGAEIFAAELVAEKVRGFLSTGPETATSG
jgi:pimeloyl-ACP methyl ester carboxylesterase